MIAFEKSVGAVIFRKEDDKIYYLLLKYRNGHWDFPKGHVENNETEKETMRREVREETGIDDLKTVPGFSSKIRFFYKAKGDEYRERRIEGRKTLITKKVVFYLAETLQKEVKLSEEQTDFSWLRYDEALNKVTYGGPKSVLEKAKTFLEKK
jgi:bis(5'-nucleosidyl)-tetraphosphatase